MYSVSQKNPPEDLWQFFQNRYEFFNQILRVYYAFLSTLDYEFLPSTLTKLCHIKRDPHSSHHVRKMSTISQNAFSDIFPKQLGIFSLNFTRLLNIHMYARVQLFVQFISNCDEVMPY